MDLKDLEIHINTTSIITRKLGTIYASRSEANYTE